MDEDMIQKLEYLKACFDYSRQICNPSDYRYRQDILLENIAEFLIYPLEKMRNDEKDQEIEKTNNRLVQKKVKKKVDLKK